MSDPTMPALFATVVSEVWTEIGNCMSTISDNALLLIPVCVGFVGAIIGLAKRFLRFGGRRGRN